jgi:serine/threonine protein phosphatase PrpC
MVDDPAIARCLAQHDSSDRAAIHLVQLALDHGGKDNVTVVVASYSIPDWLTDTPPHGESAAPVRQTTLDSTSEYPADTAEFLTWDLLP